jgi:GH25 family lysozyme M1 (1,4-beta-N-acetylmuramidase)
MRTMYDSVTPLVSVPEDAEMVGYYLNGEFAVRSVAGVYLAFKNAVNVPIDVTGSRPDYARVLDVERGAAKAGDCASWISRFNALNPAYRSGARPVIYVQKSNIESIRIGTGHYRLGHDYFLWVASWGDPYSGFGVVACQVENTPAWDRSEVYSDQWMPAALRA